MADEDKLDHAKDGPAGVLQAGRAAGRDRAGEVLGIGQAARAAGAVPAEPGGAAGGRPRHHPGGRHVDLRRAPLRRRHGEDAPPTPTTSTPSWSSRTARTRTPRPRAQQVLNRLRAEGEAESGGVRVFTIAYGKEAKEDELARVRRRVGRQGLPGLHGGHRRGLPLDLLVLLMAGRDGHPLGPGAPARGQRDVQAAEHRRAGAWWWSSGCCSACRRSAVPVAVLLYVVLWLQTFFDSGEAEKVGKAAYGEARPRRAALDARDAGPGDRPAAGAGAGDRGGDPRRRCTRPTSRWTTWSATSTRWSTRDGDLGQARQLIATTLAGQDLRGARPRHRPPLDRPRPRRARRWSTTCRPSAPRSSACRTSSTASRWGWSASAPRWGCCARAWPR